MDIRDSRRLGKSLATTESAIMEVSLVTFCLQHKSAFGDTLLDCPPHFLIAAMQTRTSIFNASRLPGILMLASCLTLAGCQGDVTTTTQWDASAAASTSSSTSLPAAVALSGSPATTVTAGTNYVFTPTVTAGGGTITFSVAGLPAWAHLRFRHRHPVRQAGHQRRGNHRPNYNNRRQ